MKKKLLAIILATATALSAISLTAKTAKADTWEDFVEKPAHWVLTSEGWTYQTEDGKRIQAWVGTYDKLYFLDDNGVMRTGWVKPSYEEHWYYLGNDGVRRQNCWQLVDGKWYHFNSMGMMETGWQNINNVWYLLGSDGDMKTGWQLLNGTWYYLENSGAMKTGWLKDGGNWYYLNASGAMVNSDRIINGVKQSFKSNGIWKGEITTVSTDTGRVWISGNGSKFYHDSPLCSSMSHPKEITWNIVNERHLKPCSKCHGSDKEVLNHVSKSTGGWSNINGNWYFKDEKGNNKTGWLNDNGTWYFLNNKGVMQTGEISINGNFYKLASNGAMQTGWVEEKIFNEVQTYYFKPSGEAARGWENINGKWYYFHEQTHLMKTGWVVIRNKEEKYIPKVEFSSPLGISDDKCYYLDKSGIMVTGWQSIDGDWNFFNSDGSLKRNEWVQTNGKWYYLSFNGSMCTSSCYVDGKHYRFDRNGAMI